MPAGPDHYIGMMHLYAHETEGVHYDKEWTRNRWSYKSFKIDKKESEVFIMAPHGGGIERGTTELALATAGFTTDFNRHPGTTQVYDYFTFNGTDPADENGRLHVTASNYDDPVALELVRNSTVSLAFHGCSNTQPAESTGDDYEACLIGGLDIPFMTLLEWKLYDAGFRNARITDQEMLNGDLPKNIINRNKRNVGVQVELTRSFRKSLFNKFGAEERRTNTNDRFWLFVNTIRHAIEKYKTDIGIAGSL